MSVTNIPCPKCGCCANLYDMLDTFIYCTHCDYSETISCGEQVTEGDNCVDEGEKVTADRISGDCCESRQRGVETTVFKLDKIDNNEATYSPLWTLDMNVTIFYYD